MAVTASGAPAGSSRRSVRMAGDIFVQDADPERVFAPVFGVTQAADVLIGNLEIPLCDTGTPLPKPNGHLRAEPRMISALTAAGFTAVGVANNHAMNYGYQGLRQMLGLLDEAGIGHAGGGGDITAAHAPLLGESGGWRYALLSYTSVYPRGMFEARADRGGLATVRVDTWYEPRERHFEVPGMPPLIKTVVSQPDADRVRSDIAAVRDQVDAVIVSWHWGVSIVHHDVVQYQRDLGRLAIDAGADLVAGHHPHTLQPVEFYRGKPICYCIGNFHHALPDPNFTPESAVFEFIFDGAAVSAVRVHPLWLDCGANPVPVETSDPRCASVRSLLGDGATVRLEADAAGRYFEVRPLAAGASQPDAPEGGTQ